LVLQIIVYTYFTYITDATDANLFTYITNGDTIIDKMPLDMQLIRSIPPYDATFSQLREANSYSAERSLVGDHLRGAAGS
jgi:hypothetical protein